MNVMGSKYSTNSYPAVVVVTRYKPPSDVVETIRSVKP
jgi:hypothetical protein